MSLIRLIYGVVLTKKQMPYRIIIILLFISTSVIAQRKKLTREDYINTYKELAMKEMQRTGIPASITLAQGMLESGNGNSTLAVKANNHFGIKCHDWKGPSVRHDDDKKRECFRKYKSAEKSYYDHSDFLTGTKRYAKLFELKPDDYKGWSRGLKSAGYATSPTYAKALIRIIEENELHKYDDLVLSSSGKGVKLFDKPVAEESLQGRKVYYNNRVRYILAKSGDTYERLSEEMHLLSWQLPKYNGGPTNQKLSEGEIVYLQPKRNKASAKHKFHTVKAGESIHYISQKYAVKEEKLRKRNMLAEDEEPKAGAVILLRGKANKAPETFKGAKKQGAEEPKPKGEEESEFEVQIEL